MACLQGRSGISWVDIQAVKSVNMYVQRNLAVYHLFFQNISMDFVGKFYCIWFKNSNTEQFFPQQSFILRMTTTTNVRAVSCDAVTMYSNSI